MADADVTPTPVASRLRNQFEQRRRLFTILAAAVAGAGLLYLLWDWLIGSHYVATDNAYVGGDVAIVTPQIAGAVAEVAVSDTQVVKRGQVLVRIADDDARVAFQRVRAEFDNARRQFRRTVATGAGLEGAIAARAAEVTSARAALDAAQSAARKAQIDFDRRNALARSGAVSGDELTAATNALAGANAQLELARAGVAQAQARMQSATEDRNANDALTRNVTVDTNPEVGVARARLAEAELDMNRTVIRAPIDGVVTRRQVQIGQRIAPGMALMTIVPVDSLYVDANFKESQLARVKVGQKVELTSMLYGSDVVYTGRVAGLSGGTGAAFALIPAQNATGNWVKVTQRLPVRITLDPAQLKEHPLRIGLTMEAEIRLD